MNYSAACMIACVLHGIPVLGATCACWEWSSKGIWTLIHIIDRTCRILSNLFCKDLSQSFKNNWLSPCKYVYQQLVPDWPTQSPIYIVSTVNYGSYDIAKVQLVCGCIDTFIVKLLTASIVQSLVYKYGYSFTSQYSTGWISNQCNFLIKCLIGLIQVVLKSLQKVLL